nr:retrovirus-related Pol polyprotein from transposon TNT 1-94 [Tanacetum cinerariifolium]
MTFGIGPGIKVNVKYNVLAVSQIVHCASGLPFLIAVCLIRQRFVSSGTAGYEGAQNRVENANSGQASWIKRYNYNDIGHIENRVALDEKQLLFITGGQDNVVDEDVDEQPVQDLALNVDNAPTEQAMFMANLSSAYLVYDEAGPSYDSDILGDSNMIPYDQYVKNNAVPVVQRNVSSVPNDAYMMILNDMHEQPAQHDLLKMKEEALKEQTIASRPIKALMVYPLNMPAMLIPRATQRSCQSRGNMIHELREKISRLTKKHSDADPIHDRKALDSYNKELHAKVNALHDLNECWRAENEKVKRHYKELYAIDVEPIPSCIRNNREVHLDYLKHLKESVETLCEIIEEAKVKRPLDRSLASACLYTKHSESRQRIKGATAASGSKPKSNTKKDRSLPAKSHMQKVEVHPKNNKSSVKRKNRVDSNIIYKHTVVQIILWYLDSGFSKQMTGDRSRLRIFVKKFIGTVRFGNDHFGAIMGYEDYVIGNNVISRVYYMEGLGHNLFFIEQFYDSDLEVAFRKHSCYVRDSYGIELIKGSHNSNLYTISVEDMLKSSPICLLSKASKNKSWLWHRCLNHLNFSTINDLARKDLVRGLPRLKFEKDHLCLACQLEYILVIVDEYSRFTWVKFLRSKDETLEFVIKFLKQIQVGLNKTVRLIRTNNGTEFVNHDLTQYYESVSIFHQKLVLRTPHEDLGKLKPTANIGIFIGYAPSRKGYRIYNKRTRRIMETIHVQFDELSEPMAPVRLKPPRVERPMSPAPRVPVPINSAGTPSSTTIDQDAPSPSQSPSSSALQSLSLLQGYRVIEAPQGIGCKLFSGGYRSRGITNNINKWASPTKKHLEALKQVFQYLRGTLNWGLWYPKDTAMALTAYADADHAGCQDTRRNKMADENAPAPAPIRSDDQILPFAAWVPIGKDANLLRDALEITPIDQANQFVSSPSSDAIMDFVNQLGYTEIIHFVSRMVNNIHQRSTSPFHLAEEDLRLGNLKFVPKGEVDEVFRMPIPNDLILNNIRNAPYYNAYLEMVAKHDQKVAAKKEEKKKTTSAKTPKSKPAIEKSSKSAPAPKPKVTKERPFKASTAKPPKPKPAQEKSTKTTPPQQAGKGKIAKVRKRPPDHSQWLKAKRRSSVTEEASTRPSAQSQDNSSANIVRDSPSPVDAETKTGVASEKTNNGGDTEILQFDEEQGKDVDDQVNLKEKTDELDEGQAGTDPGRTPESRPLPEQVVMDEDQAGLDLGKSCGALTGPDPEPTHNEFMADLYPKNLDDAYTIRDQFINDKSTEDEPAKLNVESEVVSMVTVPIH